MTPDELLRQFGVADWRAERLRLHILFWSCVWIVVMASMLSLTGSVTPHIRWDVHDANMGWVNDDGVLSTVILIEVENEGGVPVTISEISADIPGLRFLPPDETDDRTAEVTVAAGERGSLKRHVVITDCTAVPYEPRPVRFAYSTWANSGEAQVVWGSPRFNTNESTNESTNGRAGESTYERAGESAVAWQSAIAVTACQQAMRW
ncbi:hypothetical protein HII36_35595 [Nonomuraea sp. NN258]|uniref:hypothetical protein n=1 Tax=Nonomuraea antri TaxID=2730852 RepID=UPI001567F1FC|nr:hypothetical protein [Nonomuraea antri]NRQ37121.1 hypothetical protein [Nonomuraea antri]